MVALDIGNLVGTGVAEQHRNGHNRCHRGALVVGETEEIRPFLPLSEQKTLF